MIKIVFLFVFLLLAGNLVFLDYVYIKQQEETGDVKKRVGTLAESFKILTSRVEEENGRVAVNTVPAAPDASCPQSCVTTFNAALAKITPTKTVTTTKTSTTSQKGEYVITLGSGVPTSAGAWQDVYSAQGTFDTANFGNIKAFYFEVVGHTAEGEIRAKLVDDTTPFSYDGQVLSTTSYTGQLVSVAVPLISGKKTYHLRIYSSVTTNAAVDSARIRIVTQ